MSNTNQATSAGIGFTGWLGLLFIGLKLTGYIDWSWWWVLAPIWGPIAFLLAILLVIGIFALISGVMDGVRTRRAQRRRTITRDYGIRK